MHGWKQGRRIASRCASLMLVVLTACGGGGGGGGNVPDPGPGPGGGGSGGNGAIIGGASEISSPSGPPTANVLDSLVVPAAQAAAATKGVAVASVAVRPKAAWHCRSGATRLRRSCPGGERAAAGFQRHRKAARTAVRCRHRSACRALRRKLLRRLYPAAILRRAGHSAPRS